MAKLTNAQALELLATKTAESTKATQELTAVLSGITTKPQDGADGQTPYIKDGNWWIGEQDTGVNAAIQMPFIFKEFKLKASFSKKDAMRLQNGEILATDMPVKIKFPVGERFNGKTATVLNSKNHEINDFSSSLNFNNNTSTVEDGFITYAIPARKLIEDILNRNEITFLICIKAYNDTDVVNLWLSGIDGVFANIETVSNRLNIHLTQTSTENYGSSTERAYQYVIKWADGSELPSNAQVNAGIELAYSDNTNKQESLNSASGSFWISTDSASTDSMLEQATGTGYVQIEENGVIKRYLLNNVEFIATIQEIAIAQNDTPAYKQGLVTISSDGEIANIKAEDVAYLSIADTWGRAREEWINSSSRKSDEELAKLLKVEGYPDSPTYLYNEIPKYGSMNLQISFKDGKSFEYGEYKRIRNI